MSPTVIIADPNAEAVALAKAALEKDGVTVCAACDGTTAMKHIAANKPDVIVAALDLAGLSGFDIFTKVRKTGLGANLPLIAITDQLPDDEKSQLGTMFRLSSLFPRPLNIDLLVDRIKKLIEKNSADQPQDKKTVAFKGQLFEQPFHTVLLFINNRKLSGRMNLIGQDKLVVDFAAGKPYRIENYYLGLCESLLERGVIEQSEYGFVFDRATKKGEEAMEWLVRMGALSIDALRLERDRYQISKLAEVFSWVEGEFYFKGAPSEYNPSLLSSINVFELIHRGVMDSISRQTSSEFFLQHQAKYIIPTAKYNELLYFLKLEPFEIDLVDQFGGTEMFRSIVSEGKGKFEPEQAIRAVYALRILGMLEFNPDEPKRAGKPNFPMRGKPPIEDVDYVKVSISDLDSLIAAREGELENEGVEDAVEAGSVSADDFFSDMAGELDGLGDGFEPEAGPVSLGDIGAEVAQPGVDPEQVALENELLGYHADMKDKNYYQLFDLEIDRFEFQKLKTRYHELVRKFGPQNFITSAGEIMAAAEEVLSQIATAYNVVSNVVSKEEYDRQISRIVSMPAGGRNAGQMHVEVQYNSGLAFLETGDYHEAEKSFREVLDIRPTHYKAIAHLAWALYAPTNRRGNPTFCDQAMKLLRQAQPKLPEMPEIFAYKGGILLDQGKIVLAEVEFKKALGRAPKMRLALEGLKNVEKAKAGEKKGLFGRFGR